MKLFEEIYDKTHMTEQIYGNTATIYFNTKDARHAIILLQQNKWFSKSNVYGRGIYSVYNPSDLSSGYGHETVKAYIKDLSNYFCFEETVCKKVHPECKSKLTDDFDYIDWQEQKFGCKCPRSLGQLYNRYDDEPWKTFVRSVDGIIYHGNQDGDCILTYKPSLIVPIKYKAIPFRKEEPEWIDVEKKENTILDRFGTAIEPLSIEAYEYLKSKGITKRRNPNNAVVNLIVDTKNLKNIISKDTLEKLLSGEIEDNPFNIALIAYNGYMEHQKEFILKNKSPRFFGKLSAEQQERRLQIDLEKDITPLFIKSTMAALEKVTPNMKELYKYPKYISINDNLSKNIIINQSLIDLIDESLTERENSDFYAPGIAMFNTLNYFGKIEEKIPAYIFCTNEEYLTIYDGWYNDYKTEKDDPEIENFIEHVREKLGDILASTVEIYIKDELPKD